MHTVYTPPVVAHNVTNFYQAPKIVAQDPTYNDVPPLLKRILEIKRPTKNPELCALVMEQLLRDLEIEYSVDKAQNFTVIVDKIEGDLTVESKICFTSHTDTVHSSSGFNELVTEDGLLKVEGGGVLGADCGTGIYIMLEMILADVPGVYVFFAEEEKGRIGSKAYTMPLGIDAVISFDRKGTESLITEQSNRKGCSKEFADAFIETFPMPFKVDPTGVYTDSYSFFGVIPECVNLSVGYYSQHTKDECQDLGFLSKFVQACCDMKWEELPIVEQEIKGTLLGYHFYQGVAYNSLDEFCFDHPDVVAEVLEAYGLTLPDVMLFTKSPNKPLVDTPANVGGKRKKNKPSMIPDQDFGNFGDYDEDEMEMLNNFYRR